MRVTLSILFFNVVSLSFSQNWVPMDEGINFTGPCFISVDNTRNELFVHGSFLTSGNGDTLRGIGKWNGFFFEALGNGVTYNPSCYSIARYNDQLYASGAWSINWENPVYLARYNEENNTWDSLFHATREISWLNIVDDRLIISGWTDSCYHMPTSGICSFDGNLWTSLLTLNNLNGGFHHIQSVVEYKEQLYIAGNFSLPNESMEMINDIAILENNQVFRLAAGFQNGAAGSVSKLLVYKDELYMIGDFTQSTGDAGNYIMRWDGQNLKDVGGGTDFFINDMILHNDYLLAIGSFTYAGGVYSARLAYWDGNTWNTLQGGEDFGSSTGLMDAAVFKNELFVVGNFKTMYNDTFNHVAKYNHQLPGDENTIDVFINNPGEEVIVNYEDPNTYSLAVNIYTANGQQVRSYTLSNQQGYIHKSFEITGLASGVYIVEAMAGNKKVCKKLLKI